MLFNLSKLAFFYTLFSPAIVTFSPIFFLHISGNFFWVVEEMTHMLFAA